MSSGWGVGAEALQTSPRAAPVLVLEPCTSPALGRQHNPLQASRQTQRPGRPFTKQSDQAQDVNCNPQTRRAAHFKVSRLVCSPLFLLLCYTVCAGGAGPHLRAGRGGPPPGGAAVHRGPLEARGGVGGGCAAQPGGRLLHAHGRQQAHGAGGGVAAAGGCGVCRGAAGGEGSGG